MTYDTGDIIIWDNSPGHVMMVYSPTEIIHANAVRGFHIIPLDREDADGLSVRSVGDGAVRFRPPWNKCQNPDARKADLKAVASQIMYTAGYGKYRALRLGIGTSMFGSGAKARLKKYRDRKAGGDGTETLVKTITCVEAVVLCYQLVFAEGDDLFIELDAAHTMPSTLAKWLTKKWGAGQKCN